MYSAGPPRRAQGCITSSAWAHADSSLAGHCRSRWNLQPGPAARSLHTLGRDQSAIGGNAPCRPRCWRHGPRASGPSWPVRRERPISAPCCRTAQVSNESAGQFDRTAFDSAHMQCLATAGWCIALSRQIASRADGTLPVSRVPRFPGSRQSPAAPSQPPCGPSGRQCRERFGPPA